MVEETAEEKGDGQRQEPEPPSTDESLSASSDGTLHKGNSSPFRRATADK